MVTLERFRPEHLAELRPNHGDDPDFLRILALQADNGEAVSLRAPDGRIIAGGGVAVVLPGVGDAWLICTPLVIRYPLATVKTILRTVRQTVKAYRLRRLQATVDPTDQRAVAFAERLGMVKEGRLRRFGWFGQDMDLYAWCPDEGER